MISEGKEQSEVTTQVAVYNGSLDLTKILFTQLQVDEYLPETNASSLTIVCFFADSI